MTPCSVATGISIESKPTPQREINFICFAAGERKFPAVNLSRLASTASKPGRTAANSASGSGPIFWAMTTSQPELRNKSNDAMPTFDMADEVTNTRQDTRGVCESAHTRASWKRSVARQRDAQIKRRVFDRIENLHLTHCNAAFGQQMKTHVTRLHGRSRNQFEIMRGDHLFVRPKMIHRQILPSQIQIKKSATREILPVIRSESFNLVFELPFHRIPPWIPSADLNPKCPTLLLRPQINGDVGIFSLIPTQRKTRRDSARIRRPNHAIRQLLPVRIARAPIRVRGNRHGVRLPKSQILSIRRPTRHKFFRRNFLRI